MYLPYNGFALSLKEASKQLGHKIKGHMLEPALLDVAVESLEKSDGIATHDHRTIMEEMIHYLCGHHVICLSAALADRLMQTEVSLELEHIRLPFSIFEVCIEDSFDLYKGHRASGVLVTTLLDQALKDAFRHFSKLSYAKLNQLRQKNYLPPYRLIDTIDHSKRVMALRSRSPVDPSGDRKSVV